jgi:hypothetical protein
VFAGPARCLGHLGVQVVGHKLDQVDAGVR